MNLVELYEMTPVERHHKIRVEGNLFLMGNTVLDDKVAEKLGPLGIF